MKKLASVIVLISLFVSTSSFAQDLIVKQDNSKVFCKVISQDSTAIYYKQDKDNINTELSINKKDVFRCFTKANGMIFENKILSPVAKVEVKKDSILTIKKDSVNQANIIKLKRDSVLSLNDSILIKKGIYLYHGYPIGRKGILKLMQRNTEAHDEMETAIGESYFGTITAIVGGNVAGAGFANLILGKPHAIAELGIGIGLGLLFIPIKFSYHKMVRKAVKLYNTKVRVANASPPTFQLDMASTGVGIALKF
jgi:hypothetical protein